jgi:hypothetical protein
MDGYLTSEALQALNALNAMAPGKKLSGFLIGHKRGHRFFVEKIFPAPLGFRLNFKNFSRLDRLFRTTLSVSIRSEPGRNKEKSSFSHLPAERCTWTAGVPAEKICDSKPRLLILKAGLFSNRSN